MEGNEPVINILLPPEESKQREAQIERLQPVKKEIEIQTEGSEPKNEMPQWSKTVTDSNSSKLVEMMHVQADDSLHTEMISE